MRIHRHAIENNYAGMNTITSTQLAQGFYTVDERVLRDEYNNNLTRFWTTKTNGVLSRLKKMDKEGLIKLTKNGDRALNIEITSRVVFDKMKVPDGNKRVECFYLKGTDGRWDAYQI